MDIKSIQQEIVELKKEAKTVARIITARNKELDELDVKLQCKLTELKEVEEKAAEEHKKTASQRVSLNVQREKLRQDKEEYAKGKIGREKDIRLLEKTLAKLNTSVLNARTDLEKTLETIREMDWVEDSLEEKKNKLPELDKDILSLEYVINAKKGELVDLINQCNQTVTLSNKAVDKNKQEIDRLKSEAEILKIELSNLKNEIVRQKHDISIYVGRAQIVYQKAFPELEMKL